jgi:hypothetical protein
MKPQVSSKGPAWHLSHDRVPPCRVRWTQLHYSSDSFSVLWCVNGMCGTSEHMRCTTTSIEIINHFKIVLCEGILPCLRTWNSHWKCICMCTMDLVLTANIWWLAIQFSMAMKLHTKFVCVCVCACMHARYIHSCYCNQWRTTTMWNTSHPCAPPCMSV